MPFSPVTNFEALQFLREPLVVHAGDTENMNPTAKADEVWKRPTAKAVGELVEQRPTQRAFLGGAAAAAPITLANESPARAMPLKKFEIGTLDFASAGEAARAIREGSISSAELTQRMLDRIAKYNPTVAGLLSTAAPVGRTPQGLPVGVHILGPNFEDATLIDFATRIAEVAGGFVAPPEFE
jgi:hypothetical protein